MKKGRITYFLRENRKDILYAAGLILACTLLFSKTFSYPILASWDDDSFITGNRLRLPFSLVNLYYWLTTPAYDNYMPLTMYSYMLDFSISGLNGWAYRLQNVFWHIVCTLGVYSCFRAMKIGTLTAFLFALFYTIHPQRVESVAWLSERKDVLCGAFYFWGIFSYLRLCGKKDFNVIPFLFFFLAMMVKPMAISLPCVLLLYEFHRTGSFNPRYYLCRLWPYIAVAALFIPITMATDRYTGVQPSVFRKIAVIFNNIEFYIEKTIFPYDLSTFYHQTVFDGFLTAKLISFYLAAGVIAWFAFKRNRQSFIYNVIPLTACYFTSLLPIIGICPLGGIDFADRYSYIPSVFLLFGAAACLPGLYKLFQAVPNFRIKADQLHKFMVAAGIIVIAVFSSLSFFYLDDWKDFATLAKTVCDRTEPPPSALVTLGYGELAQKNYPGALRIAQRLRDYPAGSVQKQYLANFATYFDAATLYRMKHKQQALPLFIKVKSFIKKSQWSSPELYEIMLENMADCYYSEGRPQEAGIIYIELVSRTDINSFKYYYYSGLRDFCRGRITEAIKYLQQAADLDPGHQRVKSILAALQRSRSEMRKNH